MVDQLVVEGGSHILRPLPLEPGKDQADAWTNTDALAGVFKCSIDEMNACLARSRPDAPLGRQARNWVHEHQHLYHTVTTPVGLFCYGLRLMQTLATRDILIMLRSAGVPLRVPLLRHIRGTDSTAIDGVRDHLTTWLDAELFLTYQQGSPEAYESICSMYPVTRGVPTSGIFQRLQVEFARFFSGQDPNAKSVQLLEALLHEELVDPPKWRQEDRNSFVLSELNFDVPDRPFSLPMVLEGACHAVELWGSDFATFERLYAARFSDLIYLWPIAATAECVRSRSMPEILGTHLAVCDLALAAPIMPDRAGVRHGLRADEMLPHLRYFAILTALDSVGPLRGPDHYAAFVQAIYERLQWTPYDDVYATTDWSSSLLGVRAELFRSAAELRRAEPAIFITPFLSYDSEAAGTRFNDEFSFHILQFADRTVFHRNKTWLYGTQMDFICKEWMHGIMLGTPKTISLPWRAHDDELRFLGGEAQSVMSETLGWDVPPPRIVSVH